MNRTSDSLASLRHQNVERTERLLSMILGIGMTACGVANRTALGWIMTAIGGYLVYRGATGTCPLLQAAGLRTVRDVRPDLERRFGNHSRDMVEEASWESFPASDPPAW